MEGVVAGIPDLFIPEWKHWIEMKRIKGGVLSASQKKMIAEIKSIGYTVDICKGHQEAIRSCITTQTGLNSNS